MATSPIGKLDEGRADVVERTLSRARRVGMVGTWLEAAHSVGENDAGAGDSEARAEEAALRDGDAGDVTGAIGGSDVHGAVGTGAGQG